MKHLEVNCAVRHIYKSLGFKGLIRMWRNYTIKNRRFCWISLDNISRVIKYRQGDGKDIELMGEMSKISLHKTRI